MSKKKTSTDDFLRLLDDEETSSQPVAFSPHADNKQRTLYETKLSQSESSLPSEKFTTSKTDSKRITNGQQTDNSGNEKRTTNGKQTDNKQVTDFSSKSETDNKQVTKQVTEQITTPPYSSSNYLNINTTTIELPENLRRFGISVTNLQNLISSGKTTQEVVERSLAALSFDVEQGKTGNLANILFGVLGTGREYISQKYSEALQKELDAELARIQQAEESQKKLAETKLQVQFREFLSKNPNFLEEVKEKNKGFVKTQDLLEKMAFEEFKNGNV